MSFYYTLSKYYDLVFTVSPQQISFVAERTAGIKVLDIAAATGSLALALAKKGYRVTATDLETEMTKRMIQKAEEAQVFLEVMTMDMRNINVLDPKSFDTIICLGNSLVHLGSEEEILNVLRKASELLNENGQLIIQIVNYDRIILEQLHNLPTIRREGVEFHRTYEWKNDKILFRGTLIVDPNGNQEIYRETTELFPLKNDTLSKLLRAAGFSNIERYGSFRGEQYEVTSPALVVTANAGSGT